MNRRMTFHVVGVPQPKGSTRGFVPLAWSKKAAATNRPARAVITNDNPNAKQWTYAVASRAAVAIAGELQFSGAVRIDLAFTLARPPSVKRPDHTTRPDVDKLARCVLDALQGVIYANDGQVVELRARKRYAATATAPGVEITITDYPITNGAPAPANLEGSHA